MFNNVLANADYFLLMVVRTGALVVTSPVFGRVLVPSRVKILLTVALAYLFFNVVPPNPDTPIVYNSLFGYVLIVASEMLIGFALALITNIFFGVTFVAGHTIDMQIGFGMVNVYDIQNQTQAPIIGNMYNITMLLVFFLVDGHLQLIDMLYGTLEAMPVGVPMFNPGIGIVALQAFVRMFVLGVMVSLPIFASSMLIEFCFGALMKAVPQIHMMVVGVPIKLLVGFMILAATIPVYVRFCGNIFDDMFVWLDRMFAALAGAG